MILYLHGFNSNEQSRTAQFLRAYYKTEFMSLSYDYIQPDVAYKQIKEAVEAALKKDLELLIIGNSLGGFWANHFAQRFNVQCFLINPSFTPSESLRKYIGENINYNSGEKRWLTEESCEQYKKYEGPLIRHTSRVTVLGSADETVDPQQTMKLLEGLSVTFLPGEGHQIQNLEVLIPLINKTINTISG